MSGYEHVIVSTVMIGLSFAILGLTLWIIKRPDKRDTFVDEGEADRNRRFGEETWDYPGDLAYQIGNDKCSKSCWAIISAVLVEALSLWVLFFSKWSHVRPRGVRSYRFISFLLLFVRVVGDSEESQAVNYRRWRGKSTSAKRWSDKILVHVPWGFSRYQSALSLDQNFISSNEIWFLRDDKEEQNFF
jgi:hypothetical protein